MIKMNARFRSLAPAQRMRQHSVIIAGVCAVRELLVAFAR
jgi:hypothetical protein